MAKAPYGDVPYADPGYLDADGNQASKSGKPGVKRYPLSPDKVQAAWSYINQAKNAGQYTAEQLKAIKGRIKSAMAKHGHEVSDGSGGASRAEPVYFRTYELEDIHIVRAAQGDSTGRLVEAYATAFNAPAEIHDFEGHYIEEIDPAAFNKVLADISRSRAGFGKVKVMYNHGMTIHGTPSERGSMPIGTPVDIRPEARGLLTLTRYSETPFADEVLENIRNGAITAQSFTGRIVRSDPQLRNGDRHRPRGGQLTRVRRTELGLKEFGPTPFEAYTGAEILGVRMSTPGTWEPDESDEALPPDGEAAAGEPLTRDDGDEHSARYHQHELYALESKRKREAAGLVWLDARPKGTRGMATLKEMMAEQSRIVGELQRMEDSGEATEEADGSYRDTLIDRWKELDEATKPIISRMREIQAITSTAADPANTEDGDGIAPPGGDAGGYGRRTSVLGGDDDRRTPDLVTRTRTNPYDCQDAIRHENAILMKRSELRERAFDAVELEVKRGNLIDDFAEVVTRRIQDSGYLPTNNIARHVLLTGSEEYQEAFRAYLANPQGEAQRAALSLTLANGGYLLPFILDPSIILTNASSANPWRRISNVKTTTSNTWNGVNSAGVSAAWLTEGTMVTDGTPTVGNIVVTPQKAAAWVFGSYEVLEDTDFGQQLPALLADAKDRLEEAAFATGAGTGGVPQGVVNGATTVVTTATTLTIAVGDVYGVQSALPPRFRNSPKCAWVANVAIINSVRQLDTAGGSSFWTNLGKGQPETLLGAPIYESTTMSATKAVGSLEAIFGDFGQFIIVDRVGVSMIYEPLVKGTTSPFLPSGQAGWFMFWRTGSQLSTVNAFRVMKGA